MRYDKYMLGCVFVSHMCMYFYLLHYFIIVCNTARVVLFYNNYYCMGIIFIIISFSYLIY